MVAGKTLWPTLFYPKQVIKFPMRKVPFLQQEVQFSSVAQSYPTLCNPINRSTPGLPVHRVGDAIQPTHPLSSPSPPALNLSQHQGLFKWVSSWIRWPKFWSFSFNISPSDEHPGLISFRMDWLDLLAVQETLKSLLQHHSANLISAPNLSLFQTFWIFWSVQHLGVWLPCCYWVQTCIVHSMTGQ